jgi:hypothetical protein
MKNLFILIASLSVIVISCKKQYPYGTVGNPYNSRKVRFQLYTNQDFSGNSSIIHFSIFIGKANNTLLDSSLAPMQIKDIPDSMNKIIIEKTIPGNDNADIEAGFRYEIQNVGNSWFIDTIRAGSTFKVIDYAFQ